ncbi:uncharacterized protein LOC127862256 [Dreissena polymorpha]|uniref:Uncharacterized protein n=1 Tax=Dreissena polymorpha TaxID=45954 RepID=A0A9D4BHQ1_DREPO|nr:uncharacterized protein LOC127862256 [Dreissena polymorpha]XP_052257274.1 uncharacterized protein LOC127862256 [Dreissena polymorpha]XP_052257275.1 uncharacterized protein LOC127862256 [Dreissena polymorpha]KAH3695980.1 hypothetical protein DPMN_083439 [Dreissena polymorpha]
MKLLHLQSIDMVTKCSSTMATDHMVHLRQHRGHRNAYANHRKSAVELLEASKGSYVKSREVLDHRQELKHPENLSIGNREIPSVLLSGGKTSPLKDITSRAQIAEDLKNQSPPSSQRDRLLSDPDSSSSSASDGQSPSGVRKSSATSSQTSSFQTANSHQTAVTDSQVKSEPVRSSRTPPPKPPHRLTVPGEDKPVPPPKPSPPKPAVPPRPGSTVKQTIAPKPGPKPVIPLASGKPVPPSRPERPTHSCVPLETEIQDSAMSSSARKQSQSSAGKPALCDGATNSKPVSSSETRRHSSVSTSAAGGVTSADSDTSGPTYGRDPRHSLSSQHEAFLKPLCANNLSISVGVLAEKKRSPLPKPRVQKQLNEIELPPRRKLHRSQSDLSSCRHSRTSSDFSDLSSRLSRTSTEVERFFNEMGIVRSVLEPMRRLSETRTKDCQEDLSSVDSLEGNSLSSQTSNDRFPLESEQDLSERDVGPMSVVERNARIIKWLCNVKKAKTSQTRPAKTESSAKNVQSEGGTK